MQTEKDRAAMIQLGIPEPSLHTLGNLKLDTASSTASAEFDYSALLPKEAVIITAGSTHPGEEELIVPLYSRLRTLFPELYLVIVPRDPGRADDINNVVENNGLRAVLRSRFSGGHGDLLIVDTIGELIAFYEHSEMSFVGGSLVAAGGHNPIEPAIFSVPVIFGGHMEDFHEIAADLEACGGAAAVSGADELEKLLVRLLENPDLRRTMGKAAFACIENRKGVVDNHLDLLDSLL